MTTQTADATADASPDEAAIRALIERCAQGFRDTDIHAIMACHAADVVCFDAHSQYESRGADAMRAFLGACFPHMRGPTTFEVHDLTVETGGDTAFAHYLVHSSCRDTEGSEHAGWMRVSLGLRRAGGAWKACHCHVSAPFDPMTEKTMFGMARDANPFEDCAA